MRSVLSEKFMTKGEGGGKGRGTLYCNDESRLICMRAHS
jgi:hypothetical protein